VLNEIYPDKKINEWIELYNPTSSAIDLSGWSITSNKGTYTFPGTPGSGTVIIGAGQFLVIDNTDFGDDFFKNTDDSVILRDPSSTIIDQTSYKGVSNGQSWARYQTPGGSDGYDTDSETDWYKETTPTQGGSNTTMIPEYQNIFLPLFFILILVMCVKRSKKRFKQA
jgi:hypothetical protein